MRYLREDDVVIAVDVESPPSATFTVKVEHPRGGVVYLLAKRSVSVASLWPTAFAAVIFLVFSTSYLWMHTVCRRMFDAEHPSPACTQPDRWVNTAPSLLCSHMTICVQLGIGEGLGLYYCCAVGGNRPPPICSSIACGWRGAARGPWIVDAICVNAGKVAARVDGMLRCIL